MSLDVVSKLKGARCRTTDQVMGDEFVDQWPESRQTPFAPGTAADDRAKGSRRVTVVRETWAHLSMVTRMGDDGQGQRSRLAVGFN
jgi:hypothetical protein